MGRFQLGLASDAVVFGVFGEPRRFSAATLEAWRQLLLHVPHAILAFSPPFAADAVAAQRLANAAGIEPHRTAILPGIDGEGGDAWRWLFVDCALDTFPCSGPVEANGMHRTWFGFKGVVQRLRDSWNFSRARPGDDKKDAGGWEFPSSIPDRLCGWNPGSKKSCDCFDVLGIDAIR